jgi:AcrR family transcriptional regulator
MARPFLSPTQVEQRRGEILDAAGALFETEGPEAVSMRRIAARTGRSPNTPYRVFPSKGHLFLGLRIRAYQAIRKELEAADASAPLGIDRLRAISTAYIRFALDRTRAYELLFRVGDAAEDDPALASAKFEALDVCRRALADAAAEGDVHFDTDAWTAAHLFWAAAHGAVSLHLGGQLVMGRSLEQVARLLITTLLEGLSRRRNES